MRQAKQTPEARANYAEGALNRFSDPSKFARWLTKRYPTKYAALPFKKVVALAAGKIAAKAAK